MHPKIPSSPPADIDPKGGDYDSEPIFHLLRLLLHLAYIIVSIALGLLLFYMPLMGFWENNYLLYVFPQVRPIVSNPYLKGFVMGLGIANIAIGTYEIVRVKRS